MVAILIIFTLVLVLCFVFAFFFFSLRSALALSCSSRNLCCVVLDISLWVMVTLVVGHRLWTLECWLSNCGAWA